MLVILDFAKFVFVYELRKCVIYWPRDRDLSTNIAGIDLLWRSFFLEFCGRRTEELYPGKNKSWKNFLEK